MPGNYKGDPLVRVMVVIIVGTIAFGLLFNLFTGGGDMDHMGGMSGSSYGSLDSFLGGLLILLVKLLMVVLVIAVIVGVVMWIKNTFFKNTNTKFVQVINNDPILKTISVITLAVIGIILLFGLLGSFTNTGRGYGYGGTMHGGMGGYTAAFSIAGLLAILIKVLSFVLVISLILALAAYLKKQYDAGAFNFMQSNTQNVNTQNNNQQNTNADDNNAQS